jgi:hypothetical protein
MMKKVDHVGAIVKNRTLVRSKELKGLSVSRSHLWNLAKAGKIERVGHGLYRAKRPPSPPMKPCSKSRRESHSEFCASPPPSDSTN